MKYLCIGSAAFLLLHVSFLKAVSIPLTEKYIAAFKHDIGASDIKVWEPHSGSKVTYRALPLREVLTRIFGEAWKQADDIVFACADGYAPAVPVRRILSLRGFLAFSRKDGPFEVNNLKQHEEKVPLGPLYLIWDNLGNSKLRQDGATHWPYQITSVEMVRFSEKFPRLDPGPTASQKVREGFNAFRTHCLPCHTLNGDGGGKAPELNYPVSVTEYLSKSWLKKWIATPAAIRFNTAMPALEEGLANRMVVIDSIVEYLQAMSHLRRPPASQ